VALVIGGGHDQDALGGAGGGERLEQGVCRAICAPSQIEPASL